MDSIGETPIGSTTTRGVFPTNYTFPQDTLTFDSSAQPFNLVVIELIYQPKGETSFLVDNISVTASK